MADLRVRYATALFALSQEKGMVPEFLKQAQYLRDTLDNEEVKRVFTHPRISAAEKFAFFDNTFSRDIHEDLLGFLHLVIAKNREAFLLPALSALVDMIKDHQNQTTARVISAIPLSDAQASELKGLLSRKLSKEVDLAVIVDPSVLGGFSIQVDGFYFDRTVKSLLKEMKDTVKP